MRAGRIVEAATPKVLYRHPENVFTANFVGESNFLEGTVTRIADSWTVVELRNQNFLRVRANGHRLGDPVVLAIRPENTRLSAERIPNTVPGVVEDRRFMGSFLRHEIRAATDDIILVDGPLSQRFNIEDSVSIMFKEEDLRVFPMPPEGMREALKLE
jgi:ABC-type Fe3+/spermidine/putrescine transport system ATPase subunit